MRIGILLPKSTTHPLIGFDFLTGLKLSMAQGINEGEFEVFTGSIGFGIDDDAIYSETERLCLEEGVDVVIAYADHPKIDVIFPLMKALNKLLIVVNSGAKYPESWQPQDQVIYLSLNDVMNCSLTGALAVADGFENGAMVISFYDGGYSLCHALVEGFLQHKGLLEYNFVSKLNEKLETSSLLDFVKSKADKVALLSVFSWDLAPEFLKQMKEGALDNLGIYASPSLLLDGVNDIQKLSAELGDASFPIVKGFVSWWPGLTSQANELFMDSFSVSAKRKASAFAALGWDVGLVCKAIFDRGSLHDFQAIEIVSYLKGHLISGVRGDLHFDDATHHYLAPSYLVSIIDGNITLSEAPESDHRAWEEIVQTTEDLPLTGWFNTYLCS